MKAQVDTLYFVLLLLRGWLGIVMLAHGIRHVIGGGKIAGTGRWFESLGMKPGIVHAWLASLTEVGAGTMLVLGLLTPLACAGVVGVMVVAIITNHLKNGFYIFNKGEGYEYVATLIVVAVVVATIGPGKWSIDHHLDLGWLPRSNFLIATVAGGGGALALLAGFWRPVKKPEA
ncbi:MAG: putative oxidoreductase [Actinomycetota bacterium]|jgi:putative oxidoreductase